MRLLTGLTPHIVVHPPSQDFISNVMVVLLCKNCMAQDKF